jgi:hypothetical protein
VSASARDGTPQGVGNERHVTTPAAWEFGARAFQAAVSLIAFHRGVMCGEQLVVFRIDAYEGCQCRRSFGAPRIDRQSEQAKGC